MPKKSDGTIIPHEFHYKTIPYYDETPYFDNHRLSIGEVIKIIEPGDKNSFSKKFREYSVMIQEWNRGTGTTRIYPNCVLMNSLAGLADKCVYTLRADSLSGKKIIGKGSKVLVLCINGENNNAVIIGGIRDSADEKDTNKGHFFDWIFNGIEASINDSGELSITYNGKTDNDGNLNSNADASASGSNVTFNQDGSITFVTASGQTIKINKPGDEIQISGGGAVKISADNEINLNSSGSVSISGASSLSLSAATGVSISGGTGSDTGSGIKIGNGSDAMLKGSTYRKIEKDLHSDLVSAFGSMAQALLSASISLTNGDLASAGAAAAAAAGAISGFEGKSGEFLSKKNTSD